jgi:glycerate 2-kinase
LKELQDAAVKIATNAVKILDPGSLTQTALTNIDLPERIFLLAVGKAAWKMAKAAKDQLCKIVYDGIVLTNYGNNPGDITDLNVLTAGHPLPDVNSVKHTEFILDTLSRLTKEDHLLFLLSGGGSALLEKPLNRIKLNDLQRITENLLLAGATINELNVVRKHLSAVKGGRLAQQLSCNITTLILSDVMGDDSSIISSGPVSTDCSTSLQALQILDKYHIVTTPVILSAIAEETPVEVENVEITIIGNNKLLCETAAELAEKEGYHAYLYPLHLQGEAKDMGRMIGSIACKTRLNEEPVSPPCALILGGETTVRVTGSGVGGRNQELVLGAAQKIAGLKNIAVISLASDGVDGNSDAAGGVVDGETDKLVKAIGESIDSVLSRNNSYYLLNEINSMIKTGPTGNNLNDLTIILVK